MKRVNGFFRTAAGLMMLCLSVFTIIACSSSDDDPKPDLQPGDVVDNFQPVKQYAQTKAFHDDLDALVTLALDMRAVRWAYYSLASKGGKYNSADPEPFSTTADDIDNNSYCKEWTKKLYDMIDDISTRGDQYDEAIQRLIDSGVLVTPTAKTRGILGDFLDFRKSCKQSQELGRKSVIAIAREMGWTSDAAKMQKLFNDIPAEQRRGYSNSNDFWRDFSAGKLDSRANQIFVNLYTYNLDFGEQARDVGITPGKNIGIVGMDLIEKGFNLVLDASPMSGGLGYGKDLYGALDATEKLVKDGDVKGFTKMLVNNAVNYGRDLQKYADNLRGLDINYWKDFDDIWDLAGKDLTNLLINDVCFSEEAKSQGEGKLIPNLVKTYDSNGNEINIVILVDTASGKTIIGYVYDKDGNVIVNPELGGTKTITVVNRHTGKRTTKSVPVSSDKETKVEVDLEFDEEQLEENPANGELTMRPSTLKIESSGGSFRAMIVTNYLYYTCTTTTEWLSASIAKDMNCVYVKASANDTEAERKGTVTISATDSKGKVLKSTVLSVVQGIPEKTEMWVSASPSLVEFDAEGGKKEVTIDHSNELNYLAPVIGESLVGWGDIEWKETATGWNIVVNANPNTTGEERTGTFVVYAAASETARDRALKEGVFDKELVASTTVVVKQSAATEQNIEIVGARIKIAAETTVGFDSQSLYFGEAAGGGVIGGAYETIDYNNVRQSKRGSVIHVDCEMKYHKTYDVYTYSSSFDVEGLSVNPETNRISAKDALIKNVKVDYKYVSAIEGVYDWEKIVSATANKAVYTNSLTWRGDEKDGIGPDSYNYSNVFTYSDERYAYANTNEKGTLVHSDRNYIDIRLECQIK